MTSRSSKREAPAVESGTGTVIPVRTPSPCPLTSPTQLTHASITAGARVDSDAPIYQLFDKEVYQDFNFQERYPGWKELRDYFKYLDKKLDLSKDIKYDTTVEGATFDEEKRQWVIKTSDDIEYRCRWFVPAIGFAAKKYVPPYKGVDKFKGPIEHTAVCPLDPPPIHPTINRLHPRRLGPNKASTS